MAIEFLFALSILSCLVLLHSAQGLPICPESFRCGNHSPITFPFTNNSYPRCGIIVNCDEQNQRVQLGSYDVRITNGNSLEIDYPLPEKHICNLTFKNLTLPEIPFISFKMVNKLTFFKCKNGTLPREDGFSAAKYSVYKGCKGYNVYYNYPNDEPPPAGLPQKCSAIQLPVLPSVSHANAQDPSNLLTETFFLEWHTTEECRNCRHRGGQCLNINEEFECDVKESIAGKGKHYKLILGAGIPGFVLLTLLVVIIWRRYKWKKVSSYFLYRNSSYDPSSRADIEGGGVFFGVPVFSYAELEEATNNFDPNKELGDGGFGTVYHGKLRDGREVAVKRLYEHNYKRVEQFKNEIEILTRLRHQNLITLYGCTSRHSRELLLVYEYIPNGTVADHLHGDQATAVPLSWSIRMSIAIETATALAYLHASDIIHRDVKTDNILLDNNFCVKVADFGLSRLVPTDVTHVSTAPQGTPGYVDPEYYQCYELTDKSDVYSFGVVLIELISSLPAVDRARHGGEINLAKLAMNRIENCTLNELIDPCLQFESDGVVQRMTTSVAGLAYHCLKYERKMRPTMIDVLETLRGIQGQESNNEMTEKGTDSVGVLNGRGPPPSPELDDVVLLKIKEPSPSPVSVTDRKVSRFTTSNTSGGGGYLSF